MSDRNIQADIPDEASPAGGGISPMIILARRWPLVLVGLAVGVLIGVLTYLTSTPQFQSRAEVLVVRKIASTGGKDERGSIIDDYVGAQLSIIRSEKVRRATARELRKLPLSPKTVLPEDDGAVAAMVQAGLTVARDKDSTLPGTVGNGILILTFRWPEPNDAKTFLDAVIKAYQLELGAVYSNATADQLALLDKSIELNQQQQTRLSEDKMNRKRELSLITTEAIESVQGRVTSQRDQINIIESQRDDADSGLKLIHSAGPNRRDKLAVLAQLTGQTKLGIPTSTAEQPEQALRRLRMDREVMSKKLGPDHEKMQENAAQIAFVEAEIARLNPADPTGAAGGVDELGALEKKLTQDRATAAAKLQRITDRLRTDEGNLKAAVDIRSKIEALDITNGFLVGEYTDLNRRRSQTAVTSDNGGYSANAVTPPAPGMKVAPVLIQSLVFGLVIGTLLGSGAAALAELTDKSFKSPAEIRRRLGLPVIGHIPQLREAPADADAPAGLQPALVVALRPKSMEAEAYRGVRTQLYFSTQGRGHQVIQVTSANPGDGKSTLAANLAISIAQSGKRTVLIDCDFRKPQVHKLFGLEKVEAGLASVVAGTAPTARALRRSAVENLDLMPCGPRPDNPAELLTSPRFQQLIADLKDAYDFVIVDTPPVLAVSDPAAVAPRVDGVLLVFRMTKNARPAAERTREVLAAIGANLLGVIVNGGAAAGGVGYNGYNYGSNTGYRYTQYEYAEQYGGDDSHHALPARS